VDTTAPNISEHPWMEHEETGHRAQLPDIPYWRGNGWHPCDGPPPEPLLTHDSAEVEEEPAAPKKASKSKTTEDGEK
jgi:hypothetical protein